MELQNNQWLTVARTLRHMTQKEAAELIGISQGKLSKAEHCIQDLESSVWQKVSEVYDFPPSFFRQEWDSSLSANSFFRRRMSVSSKDIDSFISTVKIVKVIVDQLTEPFEMPEYSLRTYLVQEGITPQDIARKIRSDIGIYRGPVPNLVTLLENNGIIVISMDFGTDKMDGLSSITNKGRKVVFLNSRMQNDRIRFSLAHELGHVIMHLDDIIPDNRDAEDEANTFASEFLMPSNDIKPLLYNLNMAKLADLKRRWRVSMHALVKRAKDIGTISNETYRNFQINFSKRGYTKKEPIDLPSEKPLILDTLLKSFKKDLGYSDIDLMNMMKINQMDYQNWFCYHPQVLTIPIKNYS